MATARPVIELDPPPNYIELDPPPNYIELDDPPVNELKPLAALRVIDPELLGIEVDNTVPAAPPIKHPHRITFVAETPDLTIFSLGQGVPKDLNRIEDKGITGRTKSHIHFDVTEAPATFLSLGGPSTDTKIKSAHGDVPSTSKGYVLVTEGTAWTEAEKENYVISNRENLALRAPAPGKAATLQAEKGSVQAFGGTNVSILSQKGVVISSDPAISPPSAAEAKKGSEQGFAHYWAEWWHDTTSHFVTKTGNTLLAMGEMATSFVSIANGMPKTKAVAQPNTPGTTTRDRMAVAKAAADIVLWGSTVLRAAAEFAGVTDKLAGSLALYGQKFTSITGGVSASMYGGLAAAVVSPAQAEVLGGVSAVLKSLAWTEVSSSLLTGVTSLRNVEIEAIAGSVEATAHKEVKIDCEAGPVMIGAHDNVQLTSEHGAAYLFGATRAYIGAEGYGMVATKTTLDVGKITSPKDFAAAAGAADGPVITFTDTTLELKHGQALIKLMGGNLIEIRARHMSGFKLDDKGNYEVQAEKVLLG